MPACAPEPAATSTTEPPDASPAPSSSSSTPSPPASQEPTNPAAEPTSAPSGDIQVTIITAGMEADGLGATGIVTGNSESAGLCVLTATRDDLTRAAEGPVSITGGNTYCPLLVIPHSELDAGTWVLVLEYRSQVGPSGESSPTEVEVP